MTRYFWLKSDGKTIKEISPDEYFKKYKTSLNRLYTFHLIRVHLRDLFTTKKWISRAQLEMVLVETEGGV